MKHVWKTSIRRVWIASAGLLCIAFLTTSCSSASARPSRATTPPVRDTEGILAPIEPNDRNPIPEHFDSRNSSAPVPTGVIFEEFERLRAAYVIPSDLTLASSSSSAAARAFGAMLVSALRDPEPSALNMSLPGHAFGVTLHSVNNMVLIEVIQIPSRLQRQPTSLIDYPVVLCELDLNNPPYPASSAEY